MKNIALIPARCGSKGILQKNIKILRGKPLIAWSIEHALQSSSIDAVFVSTDCQSIKDIALSYGANVPFLRPKNISNDAASTESAVLHFLKWATSHNVQCDNLVLMQATSPFRYKSRIDEAMGKFLCEDADSLLSVTKTHHFFWKNPISPTASYDIYNRPRRQDIKVCDELYFENGSFYISKVDIYKKFKNRLGGKISMYEMSYEESFEIDEPIDFELIEFLMDRYHQ